MHGRVDAEPGDPGPGHRPAIALFGAAAVFAGSVGVARRGVSEREQRVFRSFNELSAWLEPVLWPPMQLGSLWGPVAVGWATWRRWRRWRPTVGVVVGGVVAWQLAKVVKGIVKRGRPADELEELVRRVGTPRDGLGFVSGHTAVAFAMVSVLWPLVGLRQRAGLMAVGAVVAFSRIHVGAHLPVDTVGGAALGVIVGETWRLLAGDDLAGTTRSVEATVRSLEATVRSVEAT